MNDYALQQLMRIADIYERAEQSATGMAAEMHQIAFDAVGELELSQRRANQPITQEILQSLGFRYEGDAEWSNRWLRLLGEGETWALTLQGRASAIWLGRILTTVGQLESLMRGLGIEVPP